MFSSPSVAGWSSLVARQAHNPAKRDRWFGCLASMIGMPPSTEDYYVYAVRNLAGRHYIGLTDDIAHRLDQHNSGGSQWTGSRGPWALVWQSGKLTLGGARKLENLLKRQKGGVGFYRMTGLIREEVAFW
jgi:putative endonuclease